MPAIETYSRVLGRSEGSVAGPPKAFIGLACLLCLPFIFGENLVLAATTIFTGLLITHLLWREGEAQYPLFVCLYQLLQVFAPVVQAEMYQLPLATMFGGVEFVKATWLSLGGVTVFSAGMAFAMRKWAPVSRRGNRQCRRTLARLNIHKLLIAWAVLFFVGEILRGAIAIPSLGTALRPIGVLRFAAALLIFQSVFVRRKDWWILILIVGGESLVGLLSYFSGFKTVYFLLLVASATYLRRDRRLWLPFSLGLVGLLGVLLFWQSVKAEYRQFLNQGEEQQVVTVSVEARLKYLKSASSREELSDTIEGSLRRLGYINYFGYCIIQVPDRIPHTQGRLWKEAIGNIIQPRILFPDKQVFHDSDRTNEFTGLMVADASKGTSIGIGYVGESYIDFGVPWMFMPIGLFGMAIGYGYAYLVRSTKPKIIGIGLGTSLLLSSILFLESSNAKMLGAFISSVMVYLVLLAAQKRLMPAWGGVVMQETRPRKKSPRRRFSDNLELKTATDE